MTMDQSLELCKRRRPIVDPNSAFMGQLRTYEKDCRDWGHLTAVNGKDCDESAGGEYGKSPRKNDSGAEFRSGDGGGEKRKAVENCGCDDKRKNKRVVGPVGPPVGPIGPAGPTRSASPVPVGPARPAGSSPRVPVGPARPGGSPTRGAIGPARPPVRSAAMGPAMGPPSRSNDKA